SKSLNKSLNLIKEKNKIFQYEDEIGGFNLMELRNRNVKFNISNRPNLCYPFYLDPNTKDSNGLYKISLEEQQGYIKVMPAISQGVQTVWRWGKEEKSRKSLNIEIFGKDNQNGGYMIVQKYRKTTKMQRSIWDEKEFVNERGTETIKELFHNNYFDYPKSPFLLRRILELNSQNNDLILDFFSGSATTAHACIQLNAEDGGNRKFIMIQLPETIDETSEAYKAGYKNICEIGKERIRRAGKKIKEENPDKKIDIGFRVFKVDDTNMKDIYYSPKNYSQNLLDQLESNIKEDRTDEDLLYGVLLGWGVELSLPHRVETVEGKKVHIINDNDLIACFEDEIPDIVVRYIANLKPTRAVFKDSSFKTDDYKINVEEIFKLISPDTTVKVI
ncbi:MAG: hypothetical protein LUE64_06220, partial [Candidatus Gastranaerophilales bacterium]|nr:hypothetical protein [Candidatus Gastranaerophilales bacterium]